MAKIEDKKLGDWLKDLIEEKQYIPMARYIQLLNLVHTLFFIGVITLKTVKRFTGLFSLYDSCKEKSVKLNRNELKTSMYEHWKPIVERSIRIIIHDEKMAKHGFKDMKGLIYYLNRFSVPIALCSASVEGVRWLVDQPFYYNIQKQILLYVSDVIKDNGQKVKALVKLKPEDEDDIEDRKGTVLYYGVEDMCYDEEEGRLCMYMPRLHSMICHQEDEVYYLKKRILCRDKAEYERYRIKEWEKRQDEAKIGRFVVYEDGSLESIDAVNLCEGVYSFERQIVTGAGDVFGPGVVFYDCKEQHFQVRLPQYAKIDTVIAVKDAFRLRQEETTYLFCTDVGVPIIEVSEAYT